jgi:hypothetical protein
LAGIGTGADLADTDGVAAPRQGHAHRGLVSGCDQIKCSGLGEWGSGEVGRHVEATHFDRFPGGCVTAQATVPAANRAEVTSQLTTIVDYTSRQALQQALDQRSGGRLQLDPPTPRPPGQPA